MESQLDPIESECLRAASPVVAMDRSIKLAVSPVPDFRGNDTRNTPHVKMYHIEIFVVQEAIVSDPSARKELEHKKS